MPGVAKLVHDASLVALLVVLVVEYLLWRPQLGAVLKPMALMAVAVTVFAVSRTGGPLCHPESLLQGHAFWHGLSAAALWVWERALR